MEVGWFQSNTVCRLPWLQSRPVIRRRQPGEWHETWLETGQRDVERVRRRIEDISEGLDRRQPLARVGRGHPRAGPPLVSQDPVQGGSGRLPEVLREGWKGLPGAIGSVRRLAARALGRDQGRGGYRLL